MDRKQTKELPVISIQIGTGCVLCELGRFQFLLSSLSRTEMRQFGAVLDLSLLRLKSFPAAKLLWRRVNQIRWCSLHNFTFYTNSNQRILHRRSTKIQRFTSRQRRDLLLLLEFELYKLRCLLEPEPLRTVVAGFWNACLDRLSMGFASLSRFAARMKFVHWGRWRWWCCHVHGDEHVLDKEEKLKGFVHGYCY
jgi:hypothetical protein